MRCRQREARRKAVGQAQLSRTADLGAQLLRSSTGAPSPVLGDEDWKDAEEHLDADPMAGRTVKKLMGIDADYYVAVPPDPTDEEMEGIRVTLRGLTSGGS